MIQTKEREGLLDSDAVLAVPVLEAALYAQTLRDFLRRTEAAA